MSSNPQSNPPTRVWLSPRTSMTVYVSSGDPDRLHSYATPLQQIAPLLQNEIVARAIEQLSNINKVLTDGLTHLKDVGAVESFLVDTSLIESFFGLAASLRYYARCIGAGTRPHQQARRPTSHLAGTFARLLALLRVIDHISPSRSTAKSSHPSSET
jgi:hypothetical protein